MPEFTIKQGDTREALAATLNDSAATSFSLAGASVKFNMRSVKTGVLIVDHGTVIVVDATARQVRYEWSVGDTAIAGDYFGEFEVTFADSSIQTFPNGVNGNILIHIAPQVG